MEEEIKRKDTLEIVGVSPELEVKILSLPSISFEEDSYYYMGEKVYRPIYSSCKWEPFTVLYHLKDGDKKLESIFDWGMKTFDLDKKYNHSEHVKTGLLTSGNIKWEIEDMWPSAIYFSGLDCNFDSPSSSTDFEFTFVYNKATAIDRPKACEKTRKLSLNWDKK